MVRKGNGRRSPSGVRKFSALGKSENDNWAYCYNKPVDYFQDDDSLMKTMLKHLLAGERSFTKFQFVLVTDKGYAAVAPDLVTYGKAGLQVAFDVSLPVLKDLHLRGLALIDGDGVLMRRESRDIRSLPGDSYSFNFALGVRRI